MRRLADLLREYGLTEIEVEHEGVRVRLRREPRRRRRLPPEASRPPRLRPKWSAASTVTAEPAASQAHLLTIEAPMVGTF